MNAQVSLFLAALLHVCSASPAYYMTLVATTAGNTMTAVWPTSAAYSSDGKTLVYAEEGGSGYGRIMALDVASNQVRVLAGSSKGGSSDGVGTAATFVQPRTVRVNASVAFISDSMACAIRRLDLQTQEVSTVYSNPYPLSSQQIQQRCYWGLAIDSARQKLYVSCAYNNTIFQLDLKTRAMSLLAGNGKEGSNNGIGAAAFFYTPLGLAYSASRSALYVSMKICLSMLIARLGGRFHQLSDQTDLSRHRGGLAVGCADGTATKASFLSPTGLVMSLDDSKLFIAQEGSNGTVRQLDLETLQVSTIAGSCVESVPYTTANTSFFLNAVLSAKVRVLSARDVSVTPQGNAVVVVDHDSKALYATILCNFVRCELGYWRTACDIKYGGACKMCTRANFSSFTREAEPFYTDSCLWACNVGYFQSGELACSVCTNPLPPNSHYSGTNNSNNCPFACDEGYELYDSCAGAAVCIEPRMRCRPIPKIFCFLSSKIPSPLCAQTPFQIRGCAKDAETLDAAAKAISAVFDEFMSSSSDLNQFFTEGLSALKARIIKAASSVSGYGYQTGIANPFDSKGPCGLVDSKPVSSSGVRRRRRRRRRRRLGVGAEC
eukprot:762714-Hanusia_phi.AAC.3